jgi:hypothetical protein
MFSEPHGVDPATETEKIGDSSRSADDAGQAADLAPCRLCAHRSDGDPIGAGRIAGRPPVSADHSDGKSEWPLLFYMSQSL